MSERERDESTDMESLILNCASSEVIAFVKRPSKPLHYITFQVLGSVEQIWD